MKKNVLSSRFASSLAAALIIAGTASADLKDDLVAYWPLDGDFTDKVGDHDGEFIGRRDDEPVFESGQFNDGIVLDGIRQYIEIGGDESDFDFVNQDFSISAWFRVNAFTKSWQALIAKGEGNRWRVHRRGGESIMTWNGGNADVPADPFGTNPPVDDDEIHHFVGVSTADEVLMYIDGELASVGPAPNVENNSMPVMIGENPDARNRTWDGLIDDVAIWGRALDEDEVSFLWNDGTGNTPIGTQDPCDFNGDGVLDGADLEMLVSESALGTNNVAFDITGDSLVNFDDINKFVTSEDKLHTYIGDANLDGEFNSTDFVEVFQAGKYETGQSATWAEGNWNGDDVFSSSDLVAAFQDGGFELGPRWQQAAAVPEPTSIIFALFAGLGLMGLVRRK